ncbi:MAG: FecCD family ABC transporter permease [Phycisphaerae bacterium]
MSGPAETLGPKLTRGRLMLAIGALVVGLPLTMLACSLIGLAELSEPVWKLRMIRITAAAIAGVALGTGGMAMQGLLRNPLAEPYILGISSGAGVGVLLGLAAGQVAAGYAWVTTPILAAAGGVVTCLIVYGIAQRRGKIGPYALLLSGVIVNAFNGAIMLSIHLFLDPHRVVDFARWAMGEFTDATDPYLLLVCGLVVGVGWLVLLLRGAAMNALGLGDDVAESLGVPVHRLRIETFIVVAVMAAAAVALAGPIGFVGLIVPHICRMIVGPDHRLLGVLSALVGGMLLVVADTACRTVGMFIDLPGRQIASIPVGILMALSGGPFFIVLLRRRTAGGSP